VTGRSWSPSAPPNLGGRPSCSRPEKPSGWPGGVAADLACDGCLPLPDLLTRYEKAGRRYMVCLHVLTAPAGRRRPPWRSTPRRARRLSSLSRAWLRATPPPGQHPVVQLSVVVLRSASPVIGRDNSTAAPAPVSLNPPALARQAQRLRQRTGTPLPGTEENGQQRRNGTRQPTGERLNLRCAASVERKFQKRPRRARSTVALRSGASPRSRRRRSRPLRESVAAGRRSAARRRGRRIGPRCLSRGLRCAQTGRWR
jgi:hypothetical protein